MSSAVNRSRLGVIIVSYGHEQDVLKLWRELESQLSETDKVVIVDNKTPHILGQKLKGQLPAEIIFEHENGGYGAGCNYGASQIVDDVDVLFFLNPDTRVSNTLLDSLRSVNKTKYDAWMPLLVLPDGRVNSAGNAVHITGLSWCEGLGDSSKHYQSDFAVNSLSGACLAITADYWLKIGGYEEQYFMYHEDVDISAKVLISGGKLGCIGNEKVTHLYDYEKGDYKWQFMERNRHIFMFINWPLSMLVLLSPMLLVAEAAILIDYIRRGKMRLKIRAYLDLVRQLRWIVSARRARRHMFLISTAAYFTHLSYKLNSPMFGTVGESTIISKLLKLYYDLVLVILSLNKERTTKV